MMDLTTLLAKAHPDALLKYAAAVSDGVVPDDNDLPTPLADEHVTDVEVDGVIATPDTDVPVAAPASKQLKIHRSNYFSHPDANAIVLDLALLQKYGPEWLEWEIETVQYRVKHDFAQSISSLNLHKLQAVRSLHLVSTYWQEWHVFTWVTMALNAVPPDFSVMQVPTVAQAMISVDMAKRINQSVEFSQEINDFLEQVQMFDGIFVPIEPLTFVTMDDVEGYPVNIEEIKSLWPAVRASGKPPTADTVTAEQLRRMLDVHQSLEASRAELRDQLSLVLYA